MTSEVCSGVGRGDACVRTSAFHLSIGSGEKRESVVNGWAEASPGFCLGGTFRGTKVTFRGRKVTLSQNQGSERISFTIFLKGPNL